MDMMQGGLGALASPQQMPRAQQPAPQMQPQMQQMPQQPPQFAAPQPEGIGLNLVRVQDSLKDLSDNQLLNYLQTGGSAPPALVLAELNRRKRMRSGMDMPEGTSVAEELAMETAMGLAAVPTQEYADGGLVSFAEGGNVDPFEALISAYPEIESYWAELERQYNLPKGYMRRTAELESTFDPQAANPRSSAKGLFQFIDSTAGQYGLDDPFDPIASSEAAARLAANNRRVFERRLERAPSGGELYFMHQQGATGATDMLLNPDTPASDFVGESAVALNAGDPNASSNAFSSMWIDRYGPDPDDDMMPPVGLTAPPAGPTGPSAMEPRPDMQASPFEMVQPFSALTGPSPVEAPLSPLTPTTPPTEMSPMTPTTPMSPMGPLSTPGEYAAFGPAAPLGGGEGMPLGGGEGMYGAGQSVNEAARSGLGLAHRAGQAVASGADRLAEGAFRGLSWPIRTGMQAARPLGEFTRGVFGMDPGAPVPSDLDIRDIPRGRLFDYSAPGIRQTRAEAAAAEEAAMQEQETPPAPPVAPERQGLSAIVDPIDDDDRARAIDALGEAERKGINWPLVMAGLGMMASERPDFLGALGEGGIAGIMQKMKQDETAARREEQELDRALKEREVAVRELAAATPRPPNTAQLNYMRNQLEESLMSYGMTMAELEAYRRGDTSMLYTPRRFRSDKPIEGALELRDLLDNELMPRYNQLRQLEAAAGLGMGGAPSGATEPDESEFEGFEDITRRR